MSSLFLIVSASLLLVLATPDSVSHYSELPSTTGFEPTAREMPQRNEDMLRGLFANYLWLSRPKIHVTVGELVGPIAEQRPVLAVSDAMQYLPVIRAAQDHDPPSTDKNHRTPRQSPATTHRAAIVTASGQQLVEKRRRRRDAALNIQRAYQLWLAA